MERKSILNKLAACVTGGAIVAASAATIAFSYSWFTNNDNVTKPFAGETAGAYFARGDGSENNPFIINKQIHLYNLAWLQYLGYFNKDEKNNSTWESGSDNLTDQYYFKIEKDLDMQGWVLPPIGTKAYPFVGHFSGDDHVISNLTISNEIGSETGQINKHPATVTENYFNKTDNPTIIGFFGVVGNAEFDSDATTYTYTESVNSVSNFYLDNVKIYTYNSNVLCGILAGYVNGSLSNAGVHYGRMNIASGTSNLSTYSFSNVSSFSLIGDYNKDKYSWDQDPDGGDAGYGTSIDIGAVYDELSTYSDLMQDTTLHINDANNNPYAVPIKFDKSGSITTKTGKYEDEIISSGTTIKPYYASTLSASKTETNIGYYSGGEVKMYRGKFNSSSVDFDKMTKADQSQVNPFASDASEELKAHITKIKQHLETQDENGIRNGDNAIVLTGTYFDDDGGSWRTFPTSDNNYTLVKDATVGDYNGDLFIPKRGIWVAPVTPGTFEFVAINTSTASQSVLTVSGIAVFLLQRNKIDGKITYLNGFTNTKYRMGTNLDEGLCGVRIPGGSSAYVPYYYGVNVTSEMIANGYEFFITKWKVSQSNPYIVYLDIGTDGGSDGDSKTTLSSFDFVEKTDDGILKITDDGYTKSGVTFKINNTDSSVASTSAYTFFFKRTSSTSVLYYFIPTSDGGFTFTPNGGNAKSGSSSDFDETTTSA